jgi:hypothetical protein
VASLKLVVVCPGGAVTGGPEALHQLVSVANVVEPGSAALFYVGSNVTPEPYRRYGCPVVSSVPESALVVLPEIWPEMARRFPRNRCALWWLSVDNFGSHGQRDLSGVGLHLCQSEYAWRFTEGFGERLMLTDWVEVEMVGVDRVPRVVVNPAKDAGLLGQFRAVAPFDVVELRGLSRSGVARMLRGSTVYVDFGSHPGRDRPPREAALAGCIVFSTWLGSAALDEDMPLPRWFKFDDVQELVEKVGEVVDGRSSAWEQQLRYRSWVMENRMWFESEVRGLLNVC